MEKFEMKLKCLKCGSSNIHIARQLDYSDGVEDGYEYTGALVLVCQECDNKELFTPSTEIIY